MSGFWVGAITVLLVVLLIAGVSWVVWRRKRADARGVLEVARTNVERAEEAAARDAAAADGAASEYVDAAEETAIREAKDAAASSSFGDTLRGLSDDSGG